MKSCTVFHGDVSMGGATLCDYCQMLHNLINIHEKGDKIYNAFPYLFRSFALIQGNSECIFIILYRSLAFNVFN